MITKLKQQGYNLPDWNNSVLNVSATIAEYLGCVNHNKTLSVLQNELSRNYKNVVHMIFDGMGTHPLAINLDQTDFLRQNVLMELKSTFPATTTCATTSITSNKLPLEHGWFGWSIHYPDLLRNIDIYTQRDSQNGEIVQDYYKISNNQDYYFKHSKAKYQLNLVAPQYLEHCSTATNFHFDTMEEYFELIAQICNQQSPQFIYAYNPEPDYTMHEFGVSSNQAKEVICNISKRLNKLVQECSDTLFIVSADHGQIDIEGNVEFYLDTELNEMLLCPPYLDARTPCFRVKEGKKSEFATIFKQKYGKDFMLFSSQELIDAGFFGNRGDKQYLLGDYIAIGTYTHKLFLYKPQDDFVFKGHHTSLTEEMLVPLILLRSK